MRCLCGCMYLDVFVWDINRLYDVHYSSCLCLCILKMSSSSFFFGVSSRPKSYSSIMQSILTNPSLRMIAKSRGLDITKVTWEDVGRSNNSCWGHQISDMTLAVEGELCPVVRKPNFTDLTCDLPIDQFKVKVGNEQGKETLELISLKDYLSSIPSKNGPVNLIKDRDNKILVSSQACILPLTDGKVEFRPKLYNYQTRSDSSALLVVLSTSTGTSAQIMLDKPQDLVYNLNGRICHFLATRLRDDRKARGVALEGKMDKEEIERNLIAVYCIPLKQKEIERSRGGDGPVLGFSTKEKSYGGWSGFGGGALPQMQAQSCLFSVSSNGPSNGSFGMAAPSMGFGGELSDNNTIELPDVDEDGAEEDIMDCGGSSVILESMECKGESLDAASISVATKGRKDREKAPKRGMDHAMLSVTEPKGPMTKSPKDFIFERDERYPIRLTLQRYRVTDTADVEPEAFSEIADTIAALYAKADEKGSLVVDGPTGRVTESEGTKPTKMPNGVQGSLSDLY
jgi:hypothetical protein